MKNVNQIILRYALLILISLGLFVSCSDDETNNANNNETARMSIKLTDAPGDYEAVFIDVQEVIIKYSGGQDDVNLAIIQPGVYDLLELTGGINLLLFDDEVPAGSISQIRLVLGTNNSIEVDGQTYPLNTPSAQQSGLKIQVNETLEAGILYEFLLDFDVDKSIVALGNGGYNLKPVIRASTEAQSGAISGAVLPLGMQTMVTADNGVDQISAFTDGTGAFVLNGVPPGTYTVTFEADAGLQLPPIIIENVEVSVGSVTILETVIF